MNEKTSLYTPALRFRWLIRFYDPILRAIFNEEKFKMRLIEQARIEPGYRVLDLGCGTATLTVMLKRTCPEATVVGLDGDQAILAIARKKVTAAGVDVELYEGMAFAPPFEPRFFDRVVSSLVFHHLTMEDKRRTLVKVRELLRPSGELHIADWGEAQNVLMRFAFFSVQLLDGFRTTSDNVRGRLIPLMKEAGFISVTETHRKMTALGTLSFYRAVVPAEA